MKAFSEPYGELLHGVNGLAADETKLKDLSIRKIKAMIALKIASVEIPTLYSRQVAAKAFSGETAP